MRSVLSIFTGLLSCCLLLCVPFGAEATEPVVYVADSGADTNAGTSDRAPKKTLGAAYEQLHGDGTVVVCGELTVLPNTFPQSDACVTLTSEYNGVDYRTAGAQLSFDVSFDIRGDTVFENIIFNQKGGNYIIACLGHNVTFGKGITMKKLGGADPTILGGAYITSTTMTYAGACFYDYTIRIDSGSWNAVIGSNRRASSDVVIGETGNVRVIINDGTFSATGGKEITDTDVIAVGGGASQNGDYTLEINGGRFAGGIYGIGYLGGNKTETLSHYKGDVSITIRGGYFNGVAVDAVENQASSYVNGDYALSVTGGTFSANLKSLSAARVRGNATAAVPNAIRANLINFGKTLYLSENGNDANNGLTADKPLATLDAASKLLDPERANVIVVAGKLSVKDGTKLRATAGLLTITGAENANTELSLGGTLTLGAATTIEKLKITGGKSATLAADGNDLTLASTVTADGVNLDGGDGGAHALRIAGGDWGRVTAGSAEGGSAGVFLSGGSVDTLVGSENAKGDVYLEIGGGTVKNGVVGAEGTVAGSLGIVATGGTVNGGIAATAANGRINGDGGLWIYGGTVNGGTRWERVDGMSYTNIPAGEASKIGSFASTDSVVYFASSGMGSGMSFLEPTSDLRAAVTALADGGTLVICGDTVLAGAMLLPDYADTVTFTSRFGGVDFRFRDRVKVRINTDLVFGGKTEIRDMDFVTAGESNFFFNAKKAVIGEGVTCTPDLDVLLTPEYPILWSGCRVTEVVSAGRKAADLSVASGTWGGIRLGNYRVTETADNLLVTTGTNKLTVSGGTFKGTVALTGMNNHRGDVTVNLTGGVFDCSILAICPPDAAEKANAVLNGDVTLNLDGGSYRGTIAIAGDPALAKYKGTYTINIGENADITRVCEILGTEGISGDGVSVINVKGTDLGARLNTTVTFSNPIVDYGPDPSVAYRDGWYYYLRCRTIGKTWALTLAKSANLCDIGAAAECVIWRAAPGDGDDLDSIWSPYINYIDGKWYIHGPCHVKGEPSVRYPYYWVAKTDDPMDGFTFGGKMADYDTDVNSFLNTNPLSWGGKLYMFSSGFFRVNDKTDRLHLEKLYVSEAADPTRFVGSMTVISQPTLSWEMSYGGVVKFEEGGVPLLSPSGTLYLTYAANETLTDSYCTGVLRFKGTESDSVADSALWEKLPRPLHGYTYGETVFSPGAMTFAPDFEGNTVGIYHAKHFSAATYNGRATYIQPVRWENDAPVMDPPSAGGAMTMKANPMPIGSRISGFTTIKKNEKDFDPAAITTAPITAEPGTTGSNPGGDAKAPNPVLIGGIAAAVLCGTAVAVIIIKKKKSQ